MPLSQGEGKLTDEQEANAAEVALWDRIVRHLRRSFAWQLFIKVALVLFGSAIAGVAQLPIPIEEAAKTRLGLTGVTFALIGGLLLLLIDHEHVGLMEQVRATLGRWRAVIADRDGIDAERRQAAAALAKANELAVMFDGLIVLVERALALQAVTLKDRLNRFVGPAAPGVIAAMGLTEGYWTLSVFCKQREAGEERMVRLASNWADRSEEERDTRGWRRGKGWTGEAWRRGEARPMDADVVERDASTPQAIARYDTDGQTEDADYSRYRSVVAVPFRDWRTGEVIGVVTATSSRTEAFDVDREKPGRRNLDTIKSFSLLAALVASARIGS